MVGAQGIYTGTSTSSTTDAKFREERKRCARTEQKRDKKGNIKEGDCIQWQTFCVGCEKRVALFSFVPKLIDVESGTIRYSKKLDGEAISVVCEDSGDALETAEQLTRATRDQAFEKMRKDVAPSSVEIKLTVLSTDQGIEEKEAKKRFRSAIAFAKANRMDRACEMVGGTWRG